MRFPAALALAASLAALVAAPTAAADPPAPAAPYGAPSAWPAAPPAERWWQPEWWQIPVVRKRRSVAMMGLGIALWGAGSIATAVGSAVTIAGLGCSFEAFGGDHRGPLHARSPERLGTARQADCGSGTTPGMAVLATGVLVSFVGIPLFLVGNTKVPLKPAEASFVPDLRVDAGAARLRWLF